MQTRVTYYTGTSIIPRYGTASPDYYLKFVCTYVAILKIIFKDDSCEFDEFQVNTHLCSCVVGTRNIVYVGDILLVDVLFFVHNNGK